MTKMLKINSFLLLLVLITFISCEKDNSKGLPIDGDGNVYDTVVIGTQTWLAENLKTTKYNNGISIPLVTDNSEWITKTSAAFCWYNNQPEIYKDDYGALYNWWAVQVSALCPIGYHVPTTEEWTTLIDYLGGENVAGGKLKLTGDIFWKNNSFATNESGFSAAGGGVRTHYDGTYVSIRDNGSWGSTSPGINNENGERLILYSHTGEAMISGGVNKKAGISVRCLKNK
jgi:uncharacterized protein (TIGR02145 family)